jgi:hypothetical protein
MECGDATMHSFVDAKFLFMKLAAGKFFHGHDENHSCRADERLLYMKNRQSTQNGFFHFHRQFQLLVSDAVHHV